MERPYNHTLDDTNSRINKAKELAAMTVNLSCEYDDKIEAEEFFVVWYCKTLQNWKALLSTARKGFPYLEVTYNGDKKEAYVDIYQKVYNVAHHDV